MSRYTHWTPRLIWRLTVLFEDNATYAEIGECLGVSTMAAMTQAHRMGLYRRENQGGR